MYYAYINLQEKKNDAPMFKKQNVQKYYIIKSMLTVNF